MVSYKTIIFKGEIHCFMEFNYSLHDDENIFNGQQVFEIDILARIPPFLNLAPSDLIELKQFVYLLFRSDLGTAAFSIHRAQHSPAHQDTLTVSATSPCL